MYFSIHLSLDTTLYPSWLPHNSQTHHCFLIIMSKHLKELHFSHFGHSTSYPSCHALSLHILLNQYWRLESVFSLSFLLSQFSRAGFWQSVLLGMVQMAWPTPSSMTCSCVHCVTSTMYQVLMLWILVVICCLYNIHYIHTYKVAESW